MTPPPQILMDYHKTTEVHFLLSLDTHCRLAVALSRVISPWASGGESSFCLEHWWRSDAVG